MKRYCKIFSVALACTVCMVMGGCSSYVEDVKFLLNNNSTFIKPSKPVATAPVKTTDKTLYGYDYISEEIVRILYGQIQIFAEELNEQSICIDGQLSERQIFEALQAFKDDHPEIFWLKSSCSYYFENYQTFVSLKYTISADDLPEYKERFYDKIQEIVSNAPDNASDFELELYINDYICDNCVYDYTVAETKNFVGDTSDAYGVLVEGNAVCEGYARAVNLLCNEFGIECVNVSGMSKTQNHIWNCVKINGEWYQLDVTWNDPDTEDDELARYMFFNLNDEKMYENHTAGKLFEELSDYEYENRECNGNLFVPECTATDFNYYIYNGAVISSLDDSENVINGILDAGENHKEYFYITIAKDADYDYLTEKLISGGYISRWIGSANMRSMYSFTLSDQTTVYTAESMRLLIVTLKYN
ncbi:MAG: hypothetical protein MJ089_06855 [Ruminococcus sp.]|nr:hypothetical protein [Ruminococcus sp.]